jgi:DNA repair ATPase RecN
MSKVLVDRDLLERLMRADADMGREGSASFTLDASDRLDRAWAELRAILAQPTEAEGVEIIGYVNPENIERMKHGELCGYMIEAKEDKRRSCAVMTVESHLAALSAVTAERDRLQQFEAAYNEWHDKTEWVQKTAEAHELGKHRADVLKDRVDQLQAEVEALRKDAERYRWLRDPCSGAEHVIYYSRGDYGRGLMSGSMLDAAIDAALAAKEA